MRAKFKLKAVRIYAAGNVPSIGVEFATEYDPTIPEDVAFNKATPSGKIEMLVDNPAAVLPLLSALGRDFYVDFHAIEPTGKAE